MAIKSEAVILMLASNPNDTSPIQLDEEAREIRIKLREAELRDRIRLETYWAVRPDDILQGLNQHEPDIVHFSSHGNRRSELVLSSSGGKAHRVSEEALVALFATVGHRLDAVVLNACFSASQASRVAEHVGIAIGMTEAVGIAAAIVFSGAFYSALGYGRSYGEALEQAKVSLLLHGIEEENVPRLFARPGVDPVRTSLAVAIEARNTESRESESISLSTTINGDNVSNPKIFQGKNIRVNRLN